MGLEGCPRAAVPLPCRIRLQPEDRSRLGDAEPLPGDEQHQFPVDFSQPRQRRQQVRVERLRGGDRPQFLPQPTGESVSSQPTPTGQC